MWQEWQARVQAALPNFAANPIYVEQDSVPTERFVALAEQVWQMSPFDPNGKTRDREFGARVVNTPLGDVTRMWLEGCVEINFLAHNLLGLPMMRTLDIGAGYGRLAVMLQPFVKSMTCVDAVPVSTELCEGYCRRFQPDVEVLSLPAFVEMMPRRQFDLAINIHSWNECTIEQVEKWLEALKTMGVPYLFTVSHGQIDHQPEPSYRTWSAELGQGPSFRPLLERDYTLMAEESLGLSPNPHALWIRK